MTSAQDTLQPPWSPGPASTRDRDTVTGPAVLCVLEASVTRSRTTAPAAELSRRFGWRLALVPLPPAASGTDRLNLIVAAALDERAELVVMPAGSAAAPALAAISSVQLAPLAPWPVVAVPAEGPRPHLDGPVVCGIADPDKDAPAARAAGRLALRLGTRLTLVHVASPSEGPGRLQHAVNAAHRGILWQALHTLDTAPPVELVDEHGDPARRLTAVAERVEAAMLVIGAATNPATDDQGADAVAGTVLADSGLPVMPVPRASVDTAAAYTAAGAPLHA